MRISHFGVFLLTHRLHVLAIVAAGLVFAGGCTTFSDTSFEAQVPEDGGASDAVSDVSDAADSGVDAVEQDVSGPVNACGGTSVLGAIPGEPCTTDASGECAGIVVCDGPEATTCAVAEGTLCNEDGRAPTQMIGAPCDSCIDGNGDVIVGVWEQSGDDYVCSAQRNPCGGCAAISGPEIGIECVAAGDVPGTTTCERPNRLGCQPMGRNPCGGLEALSSVPGLPCGEACGRGVLVCDGPNALRCDMSGEGGREGCVRPLAQEGTPCGPCRVWQYDEELDNVLCVIDVESDDAACAHCVATGAPNRCGGCAELDNGPLGDPCEGGVFACAGPNHVVCAAESVPACRGGGEEQVPGTLCRATATGVMTGQVLCASPTLPVCGYAAPLSEVSAECVGAPNFQEGATCGFRQVWVANTAGAGTDCLECRRASDVNPCGGVGSRATRTDLDGAELTVMPGTACGDCVLGMITCSTSTEAECLSEEEPERVLWYPDSDDDGFGDPNPAGIESLCPSEEGPDGFVTNADDCNDGEDSINPDASEEVGDEIDSNCDGDELCYPYPDSDRDNAIRCVDETAPEDIPVLLVSAEFGCNIDGTRSRFPAPPICDCDDLGSWDSDAGITSPFAAEMCDDEIDNNCDGEVDNGVVHYFDRDGDGFGDELNPRAGGEPLCVPGADFRLFVANNFDCDDINPQIHTFAPEICGNGVDDDCDERIDSDDPEGCFPPEIWDGVRAEIGPNR